MSANRMTVIKGLSLDIGVLPYNIHIKDQNGRLVLYGRRGLTMTAEARNKLIKKNVDIYIDPSDVSAFIDHKLKRIKKSVNDPEVPLHRKQNLIKDANSKIITNIKKNGITKDSARQATNLTESVVDLVLRSPQSYSGLLNISSISSYLYDHALNTATFAIMLGNIIYGESQKKLYLIGLGSLLMDVGMAKLNTSIINKKSKLEDKEKEYIRTHTTIGYEMLKGNDLPPYVADMALHHHERMDGSGYPDHLSGEKIRPYLRICAVADVYDALTSDRSFRKPMKQLEAIEMMLSHGNLFSRDVMHALMKIVLKNDQLINMTMEKYA